MRQLQLAGSTNLEDVQRNLADNVLPKLALLLGTARVAFSNNDGSTNGYSVDFAMGYDKACEQLLDEVRSIAAGLQSVTVGEEVEQARRTG